MKDLIIVGATAIEDKLQERVADVIESVRKARCLLFILIIIIIMIIAILLLLLSLSRASARLGAEDYTPEVTMGKYH